MLIRYHGHAQFLLTLTGGEKILLDPYDASVGFPMNRVLADVLLISHEHHDHAERAKVDGNPVEISREGRFSPLPGVRVSALSAPHDEEGGQRRGRTLMFKIETENLTLCHVGDLGRVPEKEELLFLKGADILMLPVGGVYTLDAAGALETWRLVSPKILIPMHYKTDSGGLSELASADDFLRLLPCPALRCGAALRVTRGDLAAQPRCALLSPALDNHLKGAYTENRVS